MKISDYAKNKRYCPLGKNENITLERVLLKKQGLDKSEYGKAEGYVHELSIWSNETRVR